MVHEVESQKNEVVMAANGQATGHAQAAANEYSMVNKNVSSGSSRTASIWNKLGAGINKVLKVFEASPKVPMLTEAYATGTGALVNDQLALVGEEGFELAHTPRGIEVLGKEGPEIRYLSAGTSILTHEQSKQVMALNGGKLPGYAKGTGAKVTDFVSGALDSAGDMLEEAFDFIGKSATEIWDKIKNSIGLDRLLDALPRPWLNQTYGKGSIRIAEHSVGNFLKKMADKFMESFSGGGAVSGDHTKLMKLAGIPASWFSAIDYIVTHESGWRVNATNPSSGAYGLPQSWPGSKMASAGADWRTNPITQLKWMKNYVTERYGGGPQAAAYWRAHHNYANGGWADKLSIFGEVPGEPEVAINPARDTSEDHIAEAIEARAKVNPNGFAGNLSKIINEAKQSANNMLPFISAGNNHVQATSNTQQAQPRVDGNINITMNIDSKQVSRAVYPTLKAMRSHEVIINGVGGAVPVGNGQPLGGVY